MYPREPLNEHVLGGVILYSDNFKIVFDNTLRSRLNLTFEESVPDIRKMMFVSLK